MPSSKSPDTGNPPSGQGPVDDPRPTDGAPSVRRAAGRWAGVDAGKKYSQKRFRTSRAAGRDPRAVAHLLAKHLEPGGAQRVLDVACGTGRLAPTLMANARRYIGIDISSSMLRSGPVETAGARIQGSAMELPFADRSFDLVACNRFLHHLTGASVEQAIEELLRVSSNLLVLSFWDANSFHGWRRRKGLRRSRPDQRVPISRSQLGMAIDKAGGQALGWRSAGLRRVTLQTFVLVRRR